MQRNGICVAGSLILDRHHTVGSYPDEGFLASVKKTDFSIGGTGNLIIDLCKLDSSLSVNVVAVVGEDDSGDKLLSVLGGYKNADLSGVCREGESSVTLVMNAEDTKQRTFFYIPGSSDVFDESKINWGNINSRIFHLEYLLLMKRVDSFDPEYGTHGARILKHAKDRGMITSFDMVSEKSERVREVVVPALKYTDICCINESEAEAVTGINLTRGGTLCDEAVREALLMLHKLGVCKWVVIHSPKKSYGYDATGGDTVVCESLKLPDGFIKGTTGAGDAFLSGILYGAYSGYSLKESMELAVATAACSLSENNGTDGMRSLDEVKKLRRELREREMNAE